MHPDLNNHAPYLTGPRYLYILTVSQLNRLLRIRIFRQLSSSPLESEQHSGRKTSCSTFTASSKYEAN